MYYSSDFVNRALNRSVLFGVICRAAVSISPVMQTLLNCLKEGSSVCCVSEAQLGSCPVFWSGELLQ